METDHEFDRSSLRGKAFLRLLGCVPLLALLILPLYAYFTRPYDLTLFTWLLAVEAGLCFAAFVLLGIRWRGQGGSGKKNGDKTILTEKSLYDYLMGSKVKSVARCELIIAFIWSLAALISIRTESAGEGEITVIGWIAFGLGVLGFIFMIAAAANALKPPKRITLTLSRVTYMEEVERREPGNDGTTTYDHYVYFADALIPRDKSISVSGLEYNSISTGELFYLLIVGGRIAGRFEASWYEPDEKLKKKLVDETQVTSEAIEEAANKQHLEEEILKRVAQGKLPELKAGVSHTNILEKQTPSLDEELQKSPNAVLDHPIGSSQGQSAREFYPQEYSKYFIRPHVIRIAICVIAAGILLACLMLFLRDSAYALWPATLLPLLAAARPIRELILKSRNAGKTDTVYHISSRAFYTADTLKILNQAILWMCVFLALWWAAHCFVRAEDDPGLWGPLFFFVFPPGIAAAILFIAAPLTYKKRRRQLQNGSISIVELPIIRKEAKKLTSEPDYYFWFPDIKRGDSFTIANNARVVFENGRIQVSVSPVQFNSAREGDMYTLLIEHTGTQASWRSIKWMYPSSKCVVDEDMAGYIKHIDPSQMREEDRQLL